jgi:hypothetical protein
MRIALSEGRLTKWEDLLDELDARQLQVLQAYYQVEPWGDERADLREATMAAVVAHAFSGAKIDPNKLAHYMSDESEEAELVSPTKAATMMRRFTER